MAAVHHAIAWNAFYVGYLMSLGFFLVAGLRSPNSLSALGRRAANWRGSACAPSCRSLPIITPCWGSLALPLYLLIMAAKVAWRPFWALVGVIGLVYVLFTVGYLRFAGLHVAASHNFQVFAGLPGPGYLSCTCCAAP